MAATVDDPLEALYAAWEEAQRRDAPTWPAALRCPDGCARCCARTPDVTARPVEARRVAKAVTGLSVAARAEVRRRIAEAARRLSGAAGDAPKGACPLLDDARCLVYADRPLICRAYGFAADRDGAYFGCEVLEPAVRAAGDFRLPNLDAAREGLPGDEVLDSAGRALTEIGPLAEMLDRLLPP